MLRSYEIDLEQLNNGQIVMKNPGEKYSHIGYIPHNFVLITISGTSYIVNPKYFKTIENNLVSEISCEYHSKFNSDYMSASCGDIQIKSGIYSDCKLLHTSRFNVEKYPIYLKDKNGSAKAYKSFERTAFKLEK